MAAFARPRARRHRHRFDRRTRQAKRHQKIVATLKAELGHEPTALELFRIVNIAALLTTSEQKEGRIMGGEALRGEAEQQERCINSPKLLLKALGIKATPQDTTPRLSDYLR